MQKLFAIIHEDADLLVVHKPADLVCHPTKGDEYSSLISRARIYLKTDSEPRLVNRLDRETSGLVVIAKHAGAARELGKIWESRAVTKEYLAIVHGHVAVEQGSIDAPLGKDEASKVAIKDCVRPDGTPAQTEFWVEQRLVRPTLPDGGHPSHKPCSSGRESAPSESGEKFELAHVGCYRAGNYSAKSGSENSPLYSERRRGIGKDGAPVHGEMSDMTVEGKFTLLRVVPRSGRKHQIRIHLAHLGHPIVGDKLYGGDEDLYLALVERRLTDAQRQKLMLPTHALHAGRLKFHWRGRDLDLSTPPEPAFSGFLAAA